MMMQSGDDLLEYRRKVKEKLKAKFKTSEQRGSSPAHDSKPFDEGQRKDDFGSFFGPSETVIAPRVVAESSKALLEKTLALTCTNSARGSSSYGRGGGSQMTKQVETLSQRVQMKKENREFYSSLFSDDGISVPASAQASSSSNRNKSVEVSSSQMSNPSSSSKTVQASASQRSNGGKRQIFDRNCEDRKSIGKGTSRVQGGTVDKKLSNSNGVKRAPLPSSKSNLPPLPVSNSKPPLQQKRKILEEDSKCARLLQNQTKATSSSKPQTNSRSEKSTSSNKSSMESECHPKKRAPRNDPFFDEEEDEEGGMDFRSMIRQMYGYDPNRYHDEYDDVSNMEVGFDTIMKEEKGSSKLAREEDARELRLIEEEERRERMKKKAKRRKLSN